ncbi:MAG: hypothetical protein JJT94_07495 [Bernardetiaceae bacterium]|nr:hypothetical protein [Bernardetiaceae bacterium]
MKNLSIISELGYTWLQLPKPNFLPLDILEKTETSFFRSLSNRLLGVSESADSLNANIYSIFPKKKKRGVYPEISQPQNVPHFKGRDILSANAGFNLSGLKNIVGAGADIEGKLKAATKLLYNFKTPQVLNTNVVLLEDYLNLHKKAKSVSGYMQKIQEGKIYVITEVIQTTEFYIRDASDFDGNSGISAEILEEYVGKVSANNAINNSASNELNYKSVKPITFAIKAYKILYNAKANYYSLSKVTLKQVRSSTNLKENMEGIEEFLIRIEE